jgi:hypothetical protein
MAGPAPTGIEFTTTPDAGPVHRSGWLCLGMPIKPSSLHVVECFLRLLPSFGKHRLECPIAMSAVNFGRERRIVSLIKGHLRLGDEADAESVIDSDAETLFKFAHDPMTPVPGMAVPSILQPTCIDVGPGRLGPLDISDAVSFQTALPSTDA